MQLTKSSFLKSLAIAYAVSLLAAATFITCTVGSFCYNFYMQVSTFIQQTEASLQQMASY